MTYVKIEDDIFRNPKVLSVSSGAKLLYIASICYSGSSLTDGFIPRNAPPMFGAEVGISKTAKAAVELVEAGLWDATERGYQVRNYLEFNESSEKVEKKRAAARDRANRKRGENFEESSQEVHANNPETTHEVSEPTTTTTTFSNEKETGADAPRPPKPKPKQPRPIHGPAQKIVDAYCDAVGIDQPTSWDKAGGQAKTLVKAGVTAEDIPKAVAWCRSQRWLQDGFDLGTIVSQADKWRMARQPDEDRLVL